MAEPVVSHWLSQSQARGQARANHIKEQDMIRIKELGFDHIRLPIDEVQFWDEQGNRLDEAWQLLTNALDWAVKHNLRVIVDLHTLRSHSFVLQEGQKNALYEDPAELQKLIGMWTQLSAEIKRFPVSMVAYEFMNEPVADDPEQWNQVVEKVHAALRKLEPDRKLVIGSNRWQSVGTFKDLRIPAGDKNIILSFHYYNPMFVTHYRASWTDVGRYTGTVTYPGQLISQAEYEKAPEQVQKIIRDNEGLTVWNRGSAALLRRMGSLPAHAPRPGLRLDDRHDLNLQRVQHSLDPLVLRRRLWLLGPAHPGLQGQRNV